MMGLTHVRVGVLYYVILSVAVIPMLAVFPLLFGIHGNRISIVGIMVAALAAMLPDLDSQHSIINQMNPVTGLANKIIEIITRGLELIVRLVFSIGIAILIIKYAPHIIAQIERIQFLKQYADIITYGVAILLIISGAIGGSAIISVPLLGEGYKNIISLIRKGNSFLKRIVMFLVYAGAGFFIIIYNYKQVNDGVLYLVGVLLIVAVIFPHRTFLHSIEGLCLFSYCAFYFSHKIGYSYLGSAFFLGYSSHLYLSDMFTKEGVPLSILPRIIKKIGIYDRLSKNKIFSLVYNVLNIRLRIPISSTGTKVGNKIEACYVLILIIITAVVAFEYGIALSNIKIIWEEGINAILHNNKRIIYWFWIYWTN